MNIDPYGYMTRFVITSIQEFPPSGARERTTYQADQEEGFADGVSVIAFSFIAYCEAGNFE